MHDSLKGNDPPETTFSSKPPIRSLEKCPKENNPEKCCPRLVITHM